MNIVIPALSDKWCSKWCSSGLARLKTLRLRGFQALRQILPWQIKRVFTLSFISLQNLPNPCKYALFSPLGAISIYVSLLQSGTGLNQQYSPYCTILSSAFRSSVCKNMLHDDGRWIGKVDDSKTKHRERAIRSLCFIPNSEIHLLLSGIQKTLLIPMLRMVVGFPSAHGT